MCFFVVVKILTVVVLDVKIHPHGRLWLMGQECILVGWRESPSFLLSARHLNAKLHDHQHC